MKHSFNQAQTNGKESSGSMTPPLGVGGLLLPLKNIFLTAGLVLATAFGVLAQDCATGYCPASITVHHKAGPVSPQSVDITYGVVTTALFTGTKCAITRNLGATTQATSVDDASLTSAGWYWQFNRKQGFYYNGSSVTPSTTWITTITESSDWVAANDPCTLLLGTNWRLPTLSELTYLRDNHATTGTIGYATALKLHCGGFIAPTGGIPTARGSEGDFMSSSASDAANYYRMYVQVSGGGVGSLTKVYGMSARCLRSY